MKPAPFKYVAARSLDHALALKSEYADDARFLAGGQSLVPTMNFRLSQPTAVIDVNPLVECAGIARTSDGAVRIGALTRYRMLERDALVQSDLPLIREALPHIAHPQIRNRGTIGGSLAHADPASELPCIALTLGARMKARSVRGERWIEADDFFLGILTTALESDEMLVEVEFPAPPPNSGCCFMEVSRRRGDFALAGIAARVTLRGDGTCADARLGFCGVGETPVRAREAERSLAGSRLSEADVAQAVAIARREIDPPGSIHASQEFQRHLAGVLTQRALRIATERAGHE
jgi:CO/xanthine dehydrogenase FAD-binding subunit